MSRGEMLHAAKMALAAILTQHRIAEHVGVDVICAEVMHISATELKRVIEIEEGKPIVEADLIEWAILELRRERMEFTDDAE